MKRTVLTVISLYNDITYIEMVQHDQDSSSSFKKCVLGSVLGTQKFVEKMEGQGCGYCTWCLLVLVASSEQLLRMSQWFSVAQRRARLTVWDTVNRRSSRLLRVLAIHEDREGALAAGQNETYLIPMPPRRATPLHRVLLLSWIFASNTSSSLFV